jgi:hypothetical protein
MNTPKYYVKESLSGMWQIFDYTGGLLAECKQKYNAELIARLLEKFS